MKKQLVVFLTIFLCIAALNPLQLKAQRDSVNTALHRIFENYYEEYLKLNPLEATSIGDPRYNDLLPNTGSQEFRDQDHAFFSKYLDSLKTINREQLTLKDKTSYDILKTTIERELESEKLHLEYIPFAQFYSMPLTMGQLGSGSGIQPFDNIKDYENWLSRITAYIHYVDTAIYNFRSGIKAGVVLPRSLVLKMIPQMQSLAEPDLSKNVFYKPIGKLPKGTSKEDSIRLAQAYQKAINTQLIPSYKKLGDFLNNEYLPKARPTSGLSGVTNGAALYNFFIYYWTTTRKSPEEFYNTGLKEVARITAEMEKIKDSIRFKGNLRELFEFMKTNKKFMPFHTDEEVLAANRAVLTKIQPHLKELFGLTPKTPFEIRAVEKFRAAAAAPQYNAGSPDGSRAGIYYIPILDPAKINITGWGLEVTFLHEAIPGHHYQIALQQEDTSLPKFRRYAFSGAFTEGWALYTESLGPLLGCYTDPYQRLAAYGAEIHRAIRLVVDVALHTGKMDRDQAIQYMFSHEALPMQVVTAEIERYMAMPGQALSYKTGELKIRELRDKYKKQLGGKFSLKNFHDAILKGGAMPLNVFETYMDNWAATQ
jgi:uncharacterized protein (DUF885 family)